ncbi:MAG: hypothetical protein LBV80_11700 [Deltaproteobacteria bacterium]|jgi:hypothetical protein|nr:hypothetical protein [Deltaproteobacteria bacterium]
MNVPFFACIGTDIENLVYTNNVASAARFFCQALNDLARQNKIVLIIPKYILNCVQQDGYIKAFLQNLSATSQAKIIIREQQISKCEWKTTAQEGFSTTYFMQWQIQNREIPFTIGINNINIDKEYCEGCNNRPCREAMSFCAKHLDQNFITDLEAANSLFIKQIAEQALVAFYRDFTLDLTTKKLVARLLFFREGLDCSYLPKYDDVHISNAFFEDANKESTENKCNIVLSAARAFCFPSVKDAANREKGSLDWHKDIQPCCDRADFFRADVLPGLLTGKQHSGAKRLLFCRRHSDNRIILLGYTANHDFSADKLKSRLKEAEREIK